MTITRWRTAAAITIATALGGVGITGALAQDYSGSTVTVGGGNAEVGYGDIGALQPGLTISGGDVSNVTGIGVIIGGGSSVGSSTGGGENASVGE